MDEDDAPAGPKLGPGVMPVRNFDGLLIPPTVDVPNVFVGRGGPKLVPGVRVRVEVA